MATAGLVLGVLAVIWGVIYVILAATGALNFDFSTSADRLIRAPARRPSRCCAAR